MNRRWKGLAGILLGAALLTVAVPVTVPMFAARPSWKPTGAPASVLVMLMVCDCAPAPARKLPRFTVAGREAGLACAI